MLKYDRQSRRMFLIGAGKLAIAVPLMNSLLPKAFAQSAIARRYVQVFGYSGVNPWDYWPKDLAATKIADHVYSQSLASVIAKYGKVSRIIGSDFNPIINKMSILQGLDILTNDGWGTHTYTAPANAAMNYFDGEYSGAVSYQYSIDCILEDAKKFYATTPRMGALRLFNDGDTLGDVQVGTGPIGSMRPGNGYIHPLQPGYTKTTDPRFIPPSPDAATAFRQALGGISTGGGGGSTTNPETVIRQLSSSTLTQEYQRVVNSRKISSDDKQLLSNYMDLLNQFNKSLQASVPVATMCSTQNFSYDANAINSNSDALCSAYSTLITASLACGVTRIASWYQGSHYLLTRNANGQKQYFGTDWHPESHLCSEKYTTQMEAHAKKVAELMIKMDQWKEADGSTLLDNSLVYWGHFMSSGDHNVTQMPVVVAGGAQGMLRTGAHIDYRQRDANNRPNIPAEGNARISQAGSSTVYWDHMIGRPYNNLLTTFANAMGLDYTDYEKFGQVGIGDYDPYKIVYTINGQAITRNVNPGGRNRGNYMKFMDSDAKKRAPLPYFYKG